VFCSLTLATFAEAPSEQLIDTDTIVRCEQVLLKRDRFKLVGYFLAPPLWWRLFGAWLFWRLCRDWQVFAMKKDKYTAITLICIAIGS